MPEIILSDTAISWITFALAVTLGMLVKDIVTQLVQGLMFRFSGQFNEGDHVLLDGCDAIIVSIGVRYTKFGINRGDKVYVWRYVPNDQVKYKNLEKIIRRPGDAVMGKDEFDKK